MPSSRRKPIVLLLGLAITLAACGATESSPPTPLGAITTLDFSTGFIFDVAKLGDPAYRSAHPSGIQQSAAFAGYFGRVATPIPPPGQTAVDAVNVRGRIMVVQQTVDAWMNPLSQAVLMFFPQGAVAVGPMTLGAGPSKLNVQVVRQSIPGMVCVEAIAVGQASVTVATGTDAADGGSLVVQGSHIPLYHPTATPDGDLTALIEADGVQVCP